MFNHVVHSTLMNILAQLTEFKWPAWNLRFVHQGAPPHQNTQPRQVSVGARVKQL